MIKYLSKHRSESKLPILLKMTTAFFKVYFLHSTHLLLFPEVPVSLGRIKRQRWESDIKISGLAVCLEFGTDDFFFFSSEIKIDIIIWCKLE